MSDTKCNSWSKKKIDNLEELYEVLDSATQLICDHNKSYKFSEPRLNRSLVHLLECMDYLNEIQSLGGEVSREKLMFGEDND